MTIGFAAALSGSVISVGVLAAIALSVVPTMVGFVPTWPQLHDLDRTVWRAMLYVKPFINILMSLSMWHASLKKRCEVWPPAAENSMIGSVLGMLPIIISAASPRLGILGATNDAVRGYIAAKSR